MAGSSFPCIDNKSAVLFNRNTNQQIKCFPARFVNKKNRKIVVPIGSESTVSLQVDEQQ